MGILQFGLLTIRVLSNLRNPFYYQKAISCCLLGAISWASGLALCLPANAQKLAMGVVGIHSGAAGPVLRPSVHVAGRAHTKKWIRGAFNKLPKRGKHSPHGVA